MLAQLLIAGSAAIVSAMGLGHLGLTWFSPAFSPRDAVLEQKLKSVPLVLSKRLLMWPGWIGFNASHSLGAIMFGFVYGYLALAHSAFLFQSCFLIVLGAADLFVYLILAWVYWFYLPLTGIAVALACYIGGVAVAYSG